MNQDQHMTKPSEKKYATAVFLAGVFGILGIHHFYLGRWAMGVFDLSLSIMAFGFYASEYFLIGVCLFLIDLIHTVFVTYKLLVGQYKDGQGLLITYPGQKL